MPTMSNSSGPSTCRRSVRSRNISESSESSCLSSDSKNVASSSRQRQCPADSGSPLDNNSPEQVKRKKRRKNKQELNVEKSERPLMKEPVELRGHKMEEELIKAKLKDSRIPVVLLTRLNEGHQPKLAVEKKEEKREKEDTRIKLPVGVTIPAKIDPKILKRGLVVKINKRHTESLIEFSKRRLQKQSKTEARSDIQEKESGDPVTDSEKCAERLTGKLENCLSDDNECTKNQIVNNSSKRHTRISIDKSNNRLPEKLHESDSKCTQDTSGSQPECSKTFVCNSQRLEHYPIDQSNEKDSADLVSIKSKTVKCNNIENQEKYSNDFGKDIKKYSKNMKKNIDKHSQNVIHSNCKKHFEVSGESDKKSPLLFVKESSELEPQNPCNKIKKVFKNKNNNIRPKRNLSNKTDENCVSDLDSEKNDLQFKKPENHKVGKHKTADGISYHDESVTESGRDSTQKSVNETSNKKFTKKLDKKVNECSKNETETSKKVTINVDDKKERHSDSFVEESVHFVENFVNKEDNKLEEKNKRSTRSTSEKNVKNNASTQKIRVNCTQNVVNENDKSQSQTIDKNIQKCSKNSIEISKNVKIDAKKSINFVEDNSENNSKNFNNELNDISASSTNHFVEKTNKNLSKRFDKKLKVAKTPMETRFRKSHEKLAETSITHQLDYRSHEDDNHQDLGKDSKEIPKNNFEDHQDQRPKRKSVRKNNEISNDSNNETSMKNSNENINNHPTACIKIGRKSTRKLSDKEFDASDNQGKDKNNEVLCTEKNIEKVPQNLNVNFSENSKIQTEIKRGRRKSLDKNVGILNNFLVNKVDKIPEEKIGVTECKKNPMENKMITRRTSNKQEKHDSNSIESNGDSTQSSNRENKKLLNESGKVEESSEFSVEHTKKRSRKLSDKSEKQDVKEKNFNLVKDDTKDLTNKSREVVRDVKTPTKNKMVTRMSLSNKDIDNLSKRKRDYEQKSINKSTDKLPEKSLKECSKSQTENHKKVIRKSSSDKNERLNDNVTICNSNKPESSINTNKDELSEKSEVIQIEKVTSNDSEFTQSTDDISNNKPFEESQKVIKGMPKSQTENHKRITRKSSPNKYNINNDNLSIINSDSSESKPENADDIIDKPQKIIKENFKIQSEIHEKITRKSSSCDKQERNSNNLIMNSDQSINGKNETERINNKENTKVQIEVHARVTRNSPLKKDRSPKNLIQNNVDSVQALVEEKSLENVENEAISISKDSVEIKRPRKNSVEKINESITDSLDENNAIGLPILTEDFSQSENLNQSSKKQQDDFTENKATTKKSCEKSPSKQSNNIECLQSNIEDSLIPNKGSAMIVNDKSSTNAIESRRVTRKSLEKVFENPNIHSQHQHTTQVQIQNLVPESNGCEMQLDSIENIGKCLKPTTESGSINNKNSTDVDEAKNLNEKSEVCLEPLSNSSEKDIQISSFKTNLRDIHDKNNEQNTVLVAEENENTVRDTEESPTRCSKRLALKALKNNEIQSQNLSNVSDDTSNLFTAFDKKQPANVDGIKYSLRSADENNKEAVCQTSDSLTEISYESIVREAIESQEESVVENNENNTQSTENLINEVLQDPQLNLEANENSSYKLIDDSENLSQDLLCDMSTDFTADFALGSDLNTIECSNGNSADESLMENAINEFEETVPSENNVLLGLHDTVLDEESLVHQRRRITLMELKKKCTENLDKKLGSTINELQKESTESPLPIVSTFNDNTNTYLFESAKNLSEPSSGSSPENATESETGVDSLDSDENVTDRLANLDGLDIPHLSLSDDADSGNVTSAEEKQPTVEKIVLKCPRPSFLELNADFHCNHCTESFSSNRELKKHGKIEHRQRIVMKITKTDANEHVTHMVEPPVELKGKQSESHVDKDVEERQAPATVVDEFRKSNEAADDQITDGEIKIIVKKESGSKNSHVVKEIKITPKASDSSRFPSASPAKSELSGGSSYSYRTTGYSPACYDIVQQPVKRRGRPRKYPIFTESELIAKHNMAKQADANRTALFPQVLNNGVFTPKVLSEERLLFKPVESIIGSPERVSIFQQNANHAEKAPGNFMSRMGILAQIPPMKNSMDDSLSVRSRIGRKRKRMRAFSLDDHTQLGKNVINEVESVIQEKKKMRKNVDEEMTLTSRSLSEPDLSMKHSVVKELVVRLTKIDTVPKDSDKEDVANVDEDTDRYEERPASNIPEKKKRGRPKIKPLQLSLDASSQNQSSPDATSHQSSAELIIMESPSTIRPVHPPPDVTNQQQPAVPVRSGRPPKVRLIHSPIDSSIQQQSAELVTMEMSANIGPVEPPSGMDIHHQPKMRGRPGRPAKSGRRGRAGRCGRLGRPPIIRPIQLPTDTDIHDQPAEPGMQGRGGMRGRRGRGGRRGRAGRCGRLARLPGFRSVELSTDVDIHLQLAQPKRRGRPPMIRPVQPPTDPDIDYQPGPPKRQGIAERRRMAGRRGMMAGRRGRPPKIKPVQTSSDLDSQDSQDSQDELTEPRRSGRQPKLKASESSSDAEEQEEPVKLKMSPRIGPVELPSGTNTQSADSIKTAIRMGLRRKLENNNNNVNVLEKRGTVSKAEETIAGARADVSTERCEMTTEGTKEIPDSRMPEAVDTVGITTVDSSDSVSSLNDNQEGAVGNQSVVKPQNQISDKTVVEESQKTKLSMLMSTVTPHEIATSTNNALINTTPLTTINSQQIIQAQPHPQQQLLMQPQQQQFCIIYIPDAMYSSDPAVAKDATPTATIVNFQPVPDEQMANKPVIFTPTTPTKITTHEEPAKSYVCATCTEVSDLIGRLEASLGMTEEDKSAIKCPYCSNHFQSLFYLEYHVRQEHLKCENEKQCKHSGFNSLRIRNHEATSEFEIYITYALKCRSCYDVFDTVLMLNDHVMHKHKTLVRLPPMTQLSSSATGSTSSAYPLFMHKNGGRAPAVLQCPSDCVCRPGYRSTDSTRRRCPNAMRLLEKIEPAAYEVYTCTLCKSTFLMKDEVVDHLMKMHEVSCKYACRTCLTNFRTVQMQENHHCSEITLQDIDKLINIAILPSNVGGKEDNNKYLEREDSSTDEYGTIKSVPMEQPVITASVAVTVAAPVVAAPVVVGASQRQQHQQLPAPPRPPYPSVPVATTVEAISAPTLHSTMAGSSSSSSVAAPPSNGLKRGNGAMMDTINHLLGVNMAKKPRLNHEQPSNQGQRHRMKCPKCVKTFGYRKTLHDHIIFEHILKAEGDENLKKGACNLLSLIYRGKATGQQTEQLVQLLSKYVDKDGSLLRSFMLVNRNGQENWKESAPDNNEPLNEKDLAQCIRCNAYFRHTINSGNITRHNNDQAPDAESNKPLLCEKCENGGPKTRRRTTIVNNGHHNVNSSGGASSPHHFQIIHPFACKKCPDSFPSVEELKVHKRNVHVKPGDQQLLACDMCKKIFTSAHMLEKHNKVHHEAMLDESSKAAKDESNQSRNSVTSSKDANEANDSLNKNTSSSSRRDSSDSNVGTKEPEEKLLNCSFCEEVCSSNVSLKNHLKREHGWRASICELCNDLLIDTSEVRHMLDYHIVPTKSNPRRTTVNGSVFHRDRSSCMEEDVEELIRILGKHRLQSLMMYHDFEGKCNNAIMRCPKCPELFATRVSCRFHYVWIHDDNCLLCDETFRSGSSAYQHKVDAHISTASYFWCIQRLVTAIVNTLNLDPSQPSHVLYQILAMRLEDAEQMEIQNESSIIIPRCTGEKAASEESANTTERFLEEVVLSEDQLPDSGNIIEVVIGKEDSEDDLISMLNLSPNYEGSEQTKLPNAGAAPPEEEDDDDTMGAIMSSNATPPTTPTMVTVTPGTSVALTPTLTATAMTCNGSPVVENYVPTGVCKYTLDNDEEQLCLVVTDEDLVTYRDDIESLAERISATCDSFTLEEITVMLRVHFNMNGGVSA